MHCLFFSENVPEPSMEASKEATELFSEAKPEDIVIQDDTNLEQEPVIKLTDDIEDVSTMGQESMIIKDTPNVEQVPNMIVKDDPEVEQETKVIQDTPNLEQVPVIKLTEAFSDISNMGRESMINKDDPEVEQETKVIQDAPSLEQVPVIITITKVSNLEQDSIRKKGSSMINIVLFDSTAVFFI
jgi:hypothetical protein